MDRPRDRLGRPLRTGDDAAFPGIDAGVVVSDESAWQQAMRYLDADLPFHAHEVFEVRWRQAAAQDRTVWRALAQWTAALTHEARGNHLGSVALARRAEDLLASVATAPAPIDLAHVRASCAELQRD
jgi:hypothetical protein